MAQGAAIAFQGRCGWLLFEGVTRPAPLDSRLRGNDDVRAGMTV